jgi:hypothetical protein
MGAARLALAAAVCWFVSAGKPPPMGCLTGDSPRLTICFIEKVGCGFFRRIRPLRWLETRDPVMGEIGRGGISKAVPIGVPATADRSNFWRCELTFLEMSFAGAIGL